MDNDDRPIGRVLSRREVMALLGTAGAALLAGCATQPGATPAAPAAQPTGTAAAAGAVAATGAPPTTGTSAARSTAAATGMAGPSAEAANPTAVTAQAAAAGTAAAASTAVPGCVVRPAMTEGPYYLDLDLVRSDIRSDPDTGAVKEGAPLVLTFQVSRLAGGACSPLPDAEVEIWHCDAAGVYSGVSDPRFTTTGEKWLRGSQVTDASGVAAFTTIYPGWYAGRAVHIHFTVRPTTGTVFTSQLFFPEEVTDEVHAQPPYASRGKRDRLNSADGIYRSGGGDQLLLAVARTAHGYAATFPIAVDLAASGRR